MTNSHEQKPDKQNPDKQNVKQGNLKRPVNPPRRPKPKPLVGGMEYISNSRIKGIRQPPKK